MTNEISIEVLIRASVVGALFGFIQSSLLYLLRLYSMLFYSQDRGGWKKSAMELNDEVNPPGYSAFARLP